MIIIGVQVDKDFTIEGHFMAQEIYVYRMPEKYSVENERYTQENKSRRYWSIRSSH